MFGFFPYHEVEALLLSDTAKRGLPAFQQRNGSFFPGHLARLAKQLPQSPGVAVVTGFCIASANPPAAETDGPLGSLFLAKTLHSLGIPVYLVSDCFGLPLLAVGCDFWGLPGDCLLECPAAETWHDATLWQHWCEGFFAERAIGHVIAIERAGPSHDRDSITLQYGPAAPECSEFERQVPPEHWNRHHNMRGTILDDYTAPLHRLFEIGKQTVPALMTVGIGDGANEIGFGSVFWDQLLKALPPGSPVWLPSRIATDLTLTAGVSNWAAYALAAATAWEAGCLEVLAELTCRREASLLGHLVQDAGAVDGLSGKLEPRVDGLEIEPYLQPLRKIRQLCGFEAERI